MDSNWRRHFSNNAGDLIQIHRAFCGPDIAKRIMIECFKRRPKSERINEATVCAVLDDLHIMLNDDGDVWIGKDGTR